MIRAERSDGLKVVLDNEKIEAPEIFSFLIEEFANFEAHPSKGEKEASFFEECVKPLGFEITEQDNQYDPDVDY